MEGPPLPQWDQGTPGILCVAGPHAIPVSTAVRASGDRLLFVLGRQRETLRRLRQDPRAAFCLLGAGLAVTAHGYAHVVADHLEAAPVVGLELRVDRVQDHLVDGRTEMLDGARWRWREDRAAREEQAIVRELRALAAVS